MRCVAPDFLRRSAPHRLHSIFYALDCIQKVSSTPYIVRCTCCDAEVGGLLSEEGGEQLQAHAQDLLGASRHQVLVTSARLRLFGEVPPERSCLRCRRALRVVFSDSDNVLGTLRRALECVSTELIALGPRCTKSTKDLCRRA